VKAGFLLDVNVLVAMAWPTHRNHKKVLEWLAHHAREGWATCPLTQTSFVRILSNPAFSANALTPTDALTLLRANLAHPAHRFWADEISLIDSLELFAQKLIGHQHINRCVLVGTGDTQKGKTRNDGTEASGRCHPEKSPERDFVVLI
jgi:toxin-antitoxin system PIN domain toxin